MTKTHKNESEVLTMTYSEFQNMYSKAYAEAEIKAAEIAAIEEQIRSVQQINVTEDIKNFDKPAWDNMELTVDGHLFGISENVFKNQVEEIVLDNTAVNARIEDLEQKKENVYIALANSYSQDELGDIIPVVQQEVEVLQSRPTLSQDEQEYFNTSETILTSLKKLQLEFDEMLSNKTSTYLTAINHLSAMGISVNADDFAEHFAKNVNKDIEIAIKNGDNVNDLVESIRGSLSNCDHIEESLKIAADKSLDKLIETDASFDME